MRKPFMIFEEGGETLWVPQLRDFDLGGPTPADPVHEAIEDANQNTQLLMGRFTGVWTPVFPGMTPEQVDEVTDHFKTAAQWYYFAEQIVMPKKYMEKALQQNKDTPDLVATAAKLYVDLLQTPEGRKAGKEMLQQKLLTAFEICNRFDPLGDAALNNLGASARERVLALRGGPSPAAAAA